MRPQMLPVIAALLIATTSTAAAPTPAADKAEDTRKPPASAPAETVYAFRNAVLPAGIGVPRVAEMADVAWTKLAEATGIPANQIAVRCDSTPGGGVALTVRLDADSVPAQKRR